MKQNLAKAILVVVALLGATVATVSTDAPPAGAAAGGAWPIDTYGAARTTDNVVLKWNEQALSAIRAYPPQTGPTVSARTIAVVQTAMYDAWAAYDPVAVGSTAGAPGQQPGGTPAARDEAMSHAAYRVLVDLFPPASFPDKGAYRTPDELLGGLGYDPANETRDPGTPAGVGNLAADAVIAYRHGDGSNQLGGYANTPATPYTAKNDWNVVNDKWSWQPMCVLTAVGIAAGATPFPTACSAPNYTIQKPLTPQWPSIVPFGPRKAATGYPPEFALPGPPKNADGTYSTADIDRELTDSSNLSDVQKAKAEYWADGPQTEFPPGHMALFAQALSRMRGNTSDQDVKLFFALGNALLDASIFSWTAKYQYDSARPTTGIRERYRDKLITSWLGPNKGYGKVLGQYWLPYQQLNVVTPGFPEYVSGHSTFSAAGRTVLVSFFGTDDFNAKVTIRKGSSRFEANTPAKDVVLSWKTLTAAADEAGWSRRYGGIHYESGDQQGRALGRLTGYNVWLKAQTYFNGTATG